MSQRDYPKQVHRALLFTGALTLGASSVNAEDFTIAESEASALNAANSYFAAYPERRARMMPTDVDDMLAPIAATHTKREGAEAEIFLNSPYSAMLDVGNSLLAGWDADNLNTLYSRLHRLLPARFTDQMVSPAVATTVSVDQQRLLLLQQYTFIRDNLDSFIDLQTGLGQTGTINPIGECDLELGFEGGILGGEISSRCEVSDYEATGLMLNNDFALKDNLTCVKNQDRRGTCVAHALLAAAETATMVDSGVAYNYAEQDLYFEGETETENLVNTYYEGLSTSGVLAHMDSSSYPIQLEEVWNYNRSPKRAVPVDLEFAPVGLAPMYVNSCSTMDPVTGMEIIEYDGELCSEFASQGDTTFSLPLIGTATRPAVPFNGVASVHSTGVLLMDPTFAAASLAVAKTLLADDSPIILSTGVSLRFTTPLRGGYVTYLQNSSVTGNHALVLVGFVDNADLPAGAPLATEEGYFIAKNSWGTGSADCGFIYLDQAYVRNRANYMAFLSVQ